MVNQKEEYVFGTRAVTEAVKAGKPIDKIFIKKGLDNELFHELYSAIKEAEIPFQFVPIEKINRITRKNHQGILALLSPIEFQKVENVLPMVFETGQVPLFLVLDEITDVRNIGAIIRSAECAGVSAVILPEKGSARIGPDAVKTSAGAIYNLPICRVRSIESTLKFLKESGMKIIGASEKSETTYSDLDMTLPIAIVMGAEDTGISGNILKSCDELGQIPIMGSIKSLNVSVASALMVYEAIRQRNT